MYLTGRPFSPGDPSRPGWPCVQWHHEEQQGAAQINNSMCSTLTGGPSTPGKPFIPFFPWGPWARERHQLKSAPPGDLSDKKLFGDGSFGIFSANLSPKPAHAVNISTWFTVMERVAPFLLVIRLVPEVQENPAEQKKELQECVCVCESERDYICESVYLESRVPLLSWSSRFSRRPLCEDEKRTEFLLTRSGSSLKIKLIHSFLTLVLEGRQCKDCFSTTWHWTGSCCLQSVFIIWFVSRPACSPLS